MHRARQVILLTILSLIIACLSGCAVNRATGSLTPGVELKKTDSYYVVKQPKDGRGVESIIASQLAERGFEVSYGPAEDMPEETDAKVTYIDRWMWDITMYMLELTITITDTKSDFTLANGNSYHTSLTRRSPEEMVKEILGNILDGKSE